MSVLEQSFGLMVNVDKFVKKLTDKNYKSFLFGLISTCLAQSSELISLIAISFASAGLITLAAGLCIIYGANLGSTTGAWIIAAFGVKIDIAKYAMPMVVFGVIFIINKNRRIKGIGYFLFSIGMLFLGIAYIKEGFEGIKDSVNLANFGMSGYKGVLVYSFIGFIITVITQSSHATIAIAITALAGEQVSYENALAIAIGSNVGSTIMAFIGSLNSNTQGKRLMAGHLLFNAISAIITIIFIYPLMSFVDINSSFLGIKADDYTLKLALFHTYFNTIGVMIFYPINSKVVAFLEKMIKEKI